VEIQLLGEYFRLRHLDLRNNHLAKIKLPDTIKNVYKLHLENNDLVEIEIPEMNELYKIRLLNNNIMKIKISPTLTNLEELYLNENYLCKLTIPETLINLKYLNIKLNPFLYFHSEMTGKTGFKTTIYAFNTYLFKINLEHIIKFRTTLPKTLI
jgi:hypothetical protein